MNPFFDDNLCRPPGLGCGLIATVLDWLEPAELHLVIAHMSGGHIPRTGSEHLELALNFITEQRQRLRAVRP